MTGSNAEVALLESARDAVRDTLGSSGSPVVVFSSAWPFLKEMGSTDTAAVERLLDVVVEETIHRGLLMPTFCRGYVDGVCNLDTEPSSTGVLTEVFRRRAGVRRSLSAFFSFGVAGEGMDEVLELVPADAWGTGSSYEWMEERDACFLMLGTHPTHCSYLHRLEWLARDSIDYRYDKSFEGTLIREGVSRNVRETLFVRQLEPAIENDFTPLVPALMEAGMRRSAVRGISIAAYHARAVREHVLPIMRRDPYFTVKAKSPT